MIFAITPAVIEAIKADLRVSLPEVKSAHRAESIARGMGWATNAAMRASLAGGTEERSVQSEAFMAYLSAHGFTAADRVLVNAALRVQIRAIMEAHPELTHHGFGVHDEHRIREMERQRRYVENRASMLQDQAVEEFERACEFLQQLEVTSAPTRVFHTYNIKHSAERWHRHRGVEGPWGRDYVSNGMLLVAAWYLKLQVRRESRTSFAGFLNVSTNSVRAIDEQRKPPLPEVPEGEPFMALGRLDGKFSYLAAGSNRAITLASGAHTPANLLKLAPLAYWATRFPPRDRRTPFNTFAAVGDLVRRCGQAGFFEPDKFRQAR